MVESIFKEKFGTPRQSQFAESAYGRVRFSHPDMVSGFQVGDYIWLLFMFHLEIGHSNKAKIRPPKNKNKKTGVFGT